MGKIVIAIDGLSGCGKSSTAKAVAKKLGYTYIDSGAMYRAATLHFLNNNTTLSNPTEVNKALESLRISFDFVAERNTQETFLDGHNVETEIRTMRVSNYVSEVSKLKEVRHALVSQQQKLGDSKGVVMDGRDIGTVVFPEAELKVFMTADLSIRSVRRQKEILEKGELIDLEKIKNNLDERDKMDTTRSESPLVKAKGAIEIDTSLLQFDDQVAQIVSLAKKRD